MIEVIPSTRTKPEFPELREVGFNFGVSLNKQKEKEDTIIPFAKSDYIDVVKICIDMPSKVRVLDCFRNLLAS